MLLLKTTLTCDGQGLLKLNSGQKVLMKTSARLRALPYCSNDEGSEEQETNLSLSSGGGGGAGIQKHVLNMEKLINY